MCVTDDVEEMMMLWPFRVVGQIFSDFAPSLYSNLNSFPQHFPLFAVRTIGNPTRSSKSGGCCCPLPLAWHEQRCSEIPFAADPRDTGPNLPYLHRTFQYCHIDAIAHSKSTFHIILPWQMSKSCFVKNKLCVLCNFYKNHHIRIHFEKYLTRDSRQFTIFKQYFTKSVGPEQFSAE